MQSSANAKKTWFSMSDINSALDVTKESKGMQDKKREYVDRQ